MHIYIWGKHLTFNPPGVSHSTLLQFRPHILTFDPTRMKISNLYSKKRLVSVHIRPYLHFCSGDGTPICRVGWGWGGMSTFTKTQTNNSTQVALGWDECDDVLWLLAQGLDAMHCCARRSPLALAHRHDDEMRLLLLVMMMLIMIMMIMMIMGMIHDDVVDDDDNDHDHDDDDDVDDLRVNRGYILKLQASTCRTYKRDIALCARHQCTSQNRIPDLYFTS